MSILQMLDTQLRETQALILSPTRELASQIQKVILALGDYMNVHCHACYGGTNIGEDIRKLDYGQHVISGTPGRVFGKFSCNLRGEILFLCIERFVKQGRLLPTLAYYGSRSLLLLGTVRQEYQKNSTEMNDPVIDGGLWATGARAARRPPRLTIIGRSRRSELGEFRVKLVRT